jgi:hypothetical protein
MANFAQRVKNKFVGKTEIYEKLFFKLAYLWQRWNRTMLRTGRKLRMRMTHEDIRAVELDEDASDHLYVPPTLSPEERVPVSRCVWSSADKTGTRAVLGRMEKVVKFVPLSGFEPCFQSGSWPIYKLNYFKSHLIKLRNSKVCWVTTYETWTQVSYVLSPKQLNLSPRMSEPRSSRIGSRSVNN